MIKKESPAATARERSRAADLAALFKALSDITRLRIVGLLASRELCVGELEYLLGVSQTNVSRHLERLRSAGLVASRKQAQWVYYRLRDETLESSPALERLLTEEIARSVECESDAHALRVYDESGISCAELPNCRRNRSQGEGEK